MVGMAGGCNFITTSKKGIKCIELEYSSIEEFNE
jgi:hypothetical protein